MTVREDHAGKFAVETTLGSLPEPVQQRRRVRGRRATRRHCDGKRRVDGRQSRVDLAAIANDDDPLLEASADQRIAEFRTDAGRFAGGDYERLLLHGT